MKTPSRHQAKGKLLKALGVVPSTYDFRKPLTKWQKENINRKYISYGAYIEHPNLFSAPVVKKKNAKKLKISGYLVTPRGRAIIPKGNADTVRITADGVIIKKAPGETSYTQLRQKKSDSFMDTLRGMLNKPLARNEMVTVQIGHHNPFNKAFSSYAQLFYYLENDFEPNDDDESPKNIWPLMTIVRIDGPAKQQKAKPAKPKEKTKGTPVKTRRKK